MQELLWLDEYFDENLDFGIDRANQLQWNLTIEKNKESQNWQVIAGDQVVFEANTREPVDTFLYGLGLTYVVLPDDIFPNLKDEVEGL